MKTRIALLVALLVAGASLSGCGLLIGAAAGGAAVGYCTTHYC